MFYYSLRYILPPGALPEWAQTLGMVFSIMLIAPSWGGMLNGLALAIFTVLLVMGGRAVLAVTMT